MEYLKALLGLGVQPRGLNILFSIAEDPEPQYADWKERLWSGSGKLNRSEELGTARPRFCPPLKMSGRLECLPRNGKIAAVIRESGFQNSGRMGPGSGACNPI